VFFFALRSIQKCSGELQEKPVTISKESGFLKGAVRTQTLTGESKLYPLQNKTPESGATKEGNIYYHTAGKKNR